MPHSHIPIMFNFTLHVCTNFSYCEHWCASRCWCFPTRHNNLLSCNENRKHFKPCCKRKLNMRKANGKKCLQAYFASSEWPHHNIQSDCIKNNVLMSTNQISAPFKDGNAEQDTIKLKDWIIHFVFELRVMKMPYDISLHVFSILSTCVLIYI